MCKMKQIFTIQNIVFLIIIFFVYAYRAPGDLLTPYLFAEDGFILLQRSIDIGWGALLMAGNGFYWFVQQFIYLTCYYILLPFNNITLLPQIVSVIVKIASVLAILYFTSERFEWVMKGKQERFITCIFIVLLLPNNTADIFSCDTSLPFPLFFAAFLIGLDLMCAEEAKMPNLGQTVFLTVLSLSHAASVLIAAFCGLAALRWLVSRVKENRFVWKEFVVQVIKIIFIFGASVLQVITIFSSGRGGNHPVDALNRIFAVARNYPIFPYSNVILPRRLLFVFIGIVLISAIFLFLRIPIKIMLYSISFSYVMLLFSSLMVSVEDWETANIVYPRYFFLSQQIITMILLLILVQAYRSMEITKYISLVAAVVLLTVALRTYNIPMGGPQQAFYYSEYSNLFDKDGNESLNIPIGFAQPWRVILPTSISQQFVEQELGVEVLGLRVYNAVWWDLMEWNLSVTTEDGQVPRRLLLFCNDMFYPGRGNGDEYSITTSPTISEEEYWVDVIAEMEDGVWYKSRILLTSEMYEQFGIVL